jgi:hypothetical protein
VQCEPNRLPTPEFRSGLRGAMKKYFGSEAVSEQILNFVSREFPDPQFKQPNLVRWLNPRAVDVEKAKAVAKCMNHWAKSGKKNKWIDPRISTVKALAELRGYSIDELVGHLVPQKQPNSGLDGVGVLPVTGVGLSRFLSECDQLHCYLASVDESQFFQLEAEAKKIKSLKIGIERAREWAKAFKVVGASKPLLGVHGNLKMEDIAKQTMGDLLDYRLQWTRAALPYGEDIFKLADGEAYRGVFEVIQAGRRKPFQWYPCRCHARKDESLMVNADLLQRYGHMRTYIIYYNWGPELTPEHIKDLLRQAKDKVWLKFASGDSNQT